MNRNGAIGVKPGRSLSLFSVIAGGLLKEVLLKLEAPEVLQTFDGDRSDGETGESFVIRRQTLAPRPANPQGRVTNSVPFCSAFHNLEGW